MGAQHRVVQHSNALILKTHKTLKAEQTLTLRSFPPAALGLTRSMGSSLGSLSLRFAFLCHAPDCVVFSQLCFVRCYNAFEAGECA